MNTRLHNLDYLRGLSAFGIMVYHYQFWIFKANPASEQVIGRIGIYGVSIFYILSGLTLFHVYNSETEFKIWSFFRKRVFRILPLLWLANIGSIILLKKDVDLLNIFLNFSGLFGFFAWDDYIAVGAWSIGNEFVFYALFPFFIYLQKSKLTFIMVSILVFLLSIYFCFFLLNTTQTLPQQWRNYVNPLNQAYFFLGGFLLGKYFKTQKTNNLILFICLTIGLALFVFYPASGNQIFIVTGINRLVFSLSCFLICFAFYKISFILPTLIEKSLSILGESSYSIYLLHPFVYFMVSPIVRVFAKNQIIIPQYFIAFIAISSTLMISYLSYQKFEKFFINLGRQ